MRHCPHCMRQIMMILRSLLPAAGQSMWRKLLLPGLEITCLPLCSAALAERKLAAITLTTSTAMYCVAVWI